MSVLNWIRSFWLPGDFAVIQKDTGGVNEPHPVRPIEERIKILQEKATQKRRKPVKRRSGVSTRKPTG